MGTQKIRGRGSRPTTPRGLMTAVHAAGVLAVAIRVHMALRRLEASVLEKQRRDTLVEYQRDHRRLMARAVQDPALLPVLNTYETELSTETQRRHLFANDLYIHALHGYRIGVLTRAELHGHLRLIFRSPAMREYWEATRHPRASLKDDSEEAELGRMVDDLVRALDEADPDEEWWVVGELPDP